jgi:[FeFe] hydrogenase H-cluster maturation GTPase HydF
MEKEIYMFKAPKGFRRHIGIFGKRNVGKSSLINALINQELCIVSNIPGTTTDPVEKAYELQPFGPVVFIDTAGIDDTGTLGKKRIQKTNEIIKRTDLAILIIDKNGLDDFENNLINVFKENKIPWFLVINKIDIAHNLSETNQFIKEIKGIYSQPVLTCSTLHQKGIDKITNTIAAQLCTLLPVKPMITDILKPKDLVILVVPIDKEAPVGRIILPQVQAIRELLDANICIMVLQENELAHALEYSLKQKPKLIITDSQVFGKVDKIVPKNISLTSFSILLARQKGDLEVYSKGVNAINSLKDGDKILIAELCSHRPIAEDIGRVKLPIWLKKHTGLNLIFDVVAGKNYPEDLSEYKLIIQCGGCVANQKLILSRVQEAQKQGVPITNYGIAIAFLHGILKRVLQPLNNEY